ncbi:FHA domain-containing protein [bacterium]|nr:FHA domain-containing protein [bacterium]
MDEKEAPEEGRGADGEPTEEEEAVEVAEEVVESDEKEKENVQADEAAPGDTEEAAPLLAEAKVGLKPAESPWSLRRVGEDEVFYLRFGETVLGRKTDSCDLVLRGDGYISSRHAAVVATVTTLEITDQGSTNGTFVNDDKLEPEVTRQLGAGDSIRLGQTSLTVEYHELGEALSKAGDEQEADAEEEPDGTSTEEPDSEGDMQPDPE